MGPLDGKIDWKKMTNQELMEAKNNIRYVNNPELREELDNRVSAMKGKIKESEAFLTDKIQKFKEGRVAKIDFSGMSDNELFDSINTEKYANNKEYQQEVWKRSDKILSEGERIDPLIEKVNRFDEPSRTLPVDAPKMSIEGRIKKRISGFFDIFRAKRK